MGASLLRLALSKNLAAGLRRRLASEGARRGLGALLHALGHGIAHLIPPTVLGIRLRGRRGGGGPGVLRLLPGLVHCVPRIARLLIARGGGVRDLRAERCQIQIGLRIRASGFRPLVAVGIEDADRGVRIVFHGAREFLPCRVLVGLERIPAFRIAHVLPRLRRGLVPLRPLPRLLREAIPLRLLLRPLVGFLLGQTLPLRLLLRQPLLFLLLPLGAQLIAQFSDLLGMILLHAFDGPRGLLGRGALADELVPQIPVSQARQLVSFRGLPLRVVLRGADAGRIHDVVDRVVDDAHGFVNQRVLDRTRGIDEGVLDALARAVRVFLNFHVVNRQALPLAPRALGGFGIALLQLIHQLAHGGRITEVVLQRRPCLIRRGAPVAQIRVEVAQHPLLGLLLHVIRVGHRAIEIALRLLAAAHPAQRHPVQHGLPVGSRLFCAFLELFLGCPTALLRTRALQSLLRLGVHAAAIPYALRHGAGLGRIGIIVRFVIRDLIRRRAHALQLSDRGGLGFRGLGRIQTTHVIGIVLAALNV